MGLNKQKGNMYNWVTHTWNAVKGKCSHDCSYCYMKRFDNLKPVRLDESEFTTDLGTDNTIFVGSSCDMWADDIPVEWILKILNYCEKYPDNTYLFQTKNPKRLVGVLDELHGGLKFHWIKKGIIGTTIETNRDRSNGSEYDVSAAPAPRKRFEALYRATCTHKMVSIEPIMDFDVEVMIDWMKRLDPDFVSIGADSRGCDLPEPSSDKIQKLITAISKFTTVKTKSNLKRIMVKKE